jgi:hypothetical protein
MGGGTKSAIGPMGELAEAAESAQLFVTVIDLKKEVKLGSDFCLEEQAARQCSSCIACLSGQAVLPPPTRPRANSATC